MNKWMIYLQLSGWKEQKKQYLQSQSDKKLWECAGNTIQNGKLNSHFKRSLSSTYRVKIFLRLWLYILYLIVVNLLHSILKWLSLLLKFKYMASY